VQDRASPTFCLSPQPEPGFRVRTDGSVEDLR
jgi:hypothetical protein